MNLTAVEVMAHVFTKLEGEKELKKKQRWFVMLWYFVGWWGNVCLGLDLSKCPRSYNRRCQWYPKIHSMLLFPPYLGVIRRVCHQVFHCRASDFHPLLCMHAVGHEPLSEEGKI